MVNLTKQAMAKMAEHRADIARGNFTWIKSLVPRDIGAPIIKSLWKARIPPFRDLPLDLVDDTVLAQTLHDIYSGWEEASFVKGLDPFENWSDFVVKAVAATAQAAGLRIWKTSIGYWGSDDYLISRNQPIEKTLKECELLSEYNPSDFTPADLLRDYQ